MIEMINEIIIPILSYPTSFPKVKAPNINIIVNPNKTAPNKSSFSPETSYFKITHLLKINAKMPMGTLIKNIYCQLKTETIIPPIGGPTIAPKATKVPFIPKALPLSFLGNTWVIIPWLVDIVPAAPIACRHLAKTNNY